VYDRKGCTYSTHKEKINIQNEVTLYLTIVEAVYIIYLCIQGKVAGIDVGIIYVVVSYIDKFFEPLAHILYHYENLQQGRVSIKRIDDLLQKKENIENIYEGENTEKLEGNIRFKSVNFSYVEGRQILNDVTFSINKGEKVALIGETGAGKTLIIDSLGIISGGRFSKEMIRKGETNSFVEICMYEPENENSIDGNIIVSREINSNGKNMCKINGRMVTVNELKNFMSKFIEIHGQNDNQSLLDNKFHLKYLDGFIGEKIIDIKRQYKEKYEKYLEIKQELKNNYGDEKERERKLDLLRYQFNEIEEANLKVNEEDNLEEKRKLMINSEKISKNLNEADIAIGENSIDSLNVAIRALEKIENIGFDVK